MRRFRTVFLVRENKALYTNDERIASLFEKEGFRRCTYDEYQNKLEEFGRNDNYKYKTRIREIRGDVRTQKASTGTNFGTR